MTLRICCWSTGAWVAEEVELAYGGVAPKAIMAEKAEALLQGKPWNEALLNSALEALAQDVNITPNAPGVPLILPSSHLVLCSSHDNDSRRSHRM